MHNLFAGVRSPAGFDGASKQELLVAPQPSNFAVARGQTAGAMGATLSDAGAPKLNTSSTFNVRGR